MSATIILSTVPKLGIFTVLMRWLSVTYPIFVNYNFILVFIGVLSIVFAVLFANRQKRIKRFIAYSSIGQLGYAVLLTSVFDFDACVNIYFDVTWYHSLYPKLYQKKNSCSLKHSSCSWNQKMEPCIFAISLRSVCDFYTNLSVGNSNCLVSNYCGNMQALTRYATDAMIESRLPDILNLVRTHYHMDLLESEHCLVSV